MRARVTVILKSGVLDPQGKAIEGALSSLGIAGITSVRQGKVFDVEIDGEDRGAAESALRRACETLLANTVVETYQVAMEEGAADAALAPAEPSDMAVAQPVSPPPIPAETGAARRAAVDPAAATEIAARDVDMPTEGHP